MGHWIHCPPGVKIEASFARGFAMQVALNPLKIRAAAIRRMLEYDR
jgi:hypothetical protein